VLRQGPFRRSQISAISRTAATVLNFQINVLPVQRNWGVERDPIVAFLSIVSPEYPPLWSWNDPCLPILD
jgi:hypothetical protein